MHFFEEVPEAPEDAIFGLNDAFRKDPRPDKLTLIVGAYRDENLHPVVMQAVKEAEKRLLEKEKDKEYLPIAGELREVEGLGKIAFGEEIWQRRNDQIAAVQSLGGTGALRLGADFLKLHASHNVLFSDPTWPNHRGIFSRAGFDVAAYPYYDKAKRCVDIERMLATFKKLPAKTVLLFQVSCHNPSGADLDLDVWKEIAHITNTQGLIPFFDCAYQGFGHSLEEDLKPLRLFHESDQEFLVAYSCSKNFSLYCERVGALYIVLSSKEEKHRVQSVLKTLIRGSISNPPAHGAKIVAEILSDPTLTVLWKQELKQMRERIVSMRKLLSAKVSLPDIAANQGMFCILDLPVKTIERLREEKAIYMTLDGRINLSALNESAIHRLIDALS